MAPEALKTALTERETERILNAARLVKFCGVDAADYFFDVGCAEMKLRATLGDRKGKAAFEALPAILTWDVWQMLDDVNRARVVKATGSFEVAKRAFPSHYSDIFLAPSLNMLVRSLRIARFAGDEKELPKILDQIADVLAIRIKGGTGAPVRSWAKRLYAVNALDEIELMQATFKSKVATLDPKCKTEDQVMAALGASRLDPLTKQIARYQQTKGRRGALSPSDRTRLAFLEIHRGLDGDRRPVTDEDLDEIEKLVAAWKGAAARLRDFADEYFKVLET